MKRSFIMVEIPGQRQGHIGSVRAIVYMISAMGMMRCQRRSCMAASIQYSVFSIQCPFSRD
jgi:hypothetical protein